jgi:hypothetical protein
MRALHPPRVLSRFNKVEQAVILGGVYIALQMMSDIAATKVMMVGRLVMDAGFIYSVTFTWRDVIHKRLGRDSARIAIVLAGIINLFMAGYFYLVVQLPAEPSWVAIGGQQAWALIFGLVPRVVIASILAEVVSELVDTEVYSVWVRRWFDRPQWTRVAVSNAISIPLDSAIFVVLAFGGVLPPEVLVAMFLSNIAIKALVTVLTFWLIYLVPEEDAPGESLAAPPAPPSPEHPPAPRPDPALRSP